jgi:hypothetical protein
MADMSDLVAAVRVVNATDGDPAAQEFAMQRAVTIASQLDIGAEAARGAAAGIAAPAGLRGELGSWGESLVAEVAAGDGWLPIHHVVKPGETGLDLVLFHPPTEQIQVVEVKTTGRADARFAPTKNKEHRQVSDAHLDGRVPQGGALRRAGLENTNASDVTVRGVQVNLARGELRWFRREDGEARTWKQTSVSPLPAPQHGAQAETGQQPTRDRPAPPNPAADSGRSGHGASGRVIPGDRRIPAGNRRFAL